MTFARPLLLIAPNRFEDAAWNLPVAESEAMLLRRTFESRGFTDVRVVAGVAATSAAIASALRRLGEVATAHVPAAIIFIGHCGVGDDGRYYVATRETSWDGEGRILADSGFALSDLAVALGRFPRPPLLIVNAGLALSDVAGRARGSLPAAAAELLAQVALLLTSARPGEPSYLVPALDAPSAQRSEEPSLFGAALIDTLWRWQDEGDPLDQLDSIQSAVDTRLATFLEPRGLRQVVTRFPDPVEALQESATKGNVIVGGGEHVWEDRRIDAAMPRECQIGRATEVRYMVALPGSDGLRATLPDVTALGDPIARGDVDSSPVPIDFPAHVQKITLYVSMSAEHFTPRNRVEPLVVPRGRDSGVGVFRLTPRKSGERQLVTVRLYGDAACRELLGAVSLGSEVRLGDQPGPFAHIWQLLSRPFQPAPAPSDSPAPLAPSHLIYIDQRQSDSFHLSGIQGSIINVKSQLSQVQQQIAPAATHPQVSARLAEQIDAVEAQLRSGRGIEPGWIEGLNQLLDALNRELAVAEPNRSQIADLAAQLGAQAAALRGSVPGLSVLSATLAPHLGAS